MARRPRLVLPGGLHLVIHRGQGVRPVFDGEASRLDYLAALRQSAREHGVAIHGYGLQDHELRLLATPMDALALGRLIQAVDRRCIRELNRRRGVAGSPWEGRFRSAVVDAATHYAETLRHVELTEPLDPGREEPPSAWSSLRHHLGLVTDPLITEHPAHWRFGNTPFDRELAYRRFVEAPVADSLATVLLGASNGWPVGSDAFARKLEVEMGHQAIPRSAGRPRLPA